MRNLVVARNAAGETHCVLENGVVVADCDDLSLLEDHYGLNVKSSDKKFIDAVGHWLDTAKTREVEDLVTRSLERHDDSIKRAEHAAVIRREARAGFAMSRREMKKAEALARRLTRDELCALARSDHARVRTLAMMALETVA